MRRANMRGAGELAKLAGTGRTTYHNDRSVICQEHPDSDCPAYRRICDYCNAAICAMLGPWLLDAGWWYDRDFSKEAELGCIEGEAVFMVRCPNHTPIAQATLF